MKVDRVLVPLDGSPLAEIALPQALAVLRDSPSATLILLLYPTLPTQRVVGVHSPGFEPSRSPDARVQRGWSCAPRAASGSF